MRFLQSEESLVDNNSTIFNLTLMESGRLKITFLIFCSLIQVSKNIMGNLANRARSASDHNVEFNSGLGSFVC